MARILVVDDLPENIQLLTFALEDDNYEVVTANNGGDCLAKVEECKPDLILLDIMMPEMDGMTALKRLKTNRLTASIPVIMVSANEDEDRVVSTLDIGAHDFVSKPVNYHILAARMRSALRLREAQKQLTRLNHDLARLASIDPLTGSYNRRHYFQHSEIEFRKSMRYNRPLSIIMIDIDHFKMINDQYGHAVGDLALVQIAKVCQALIRSSDIMGRLGGEEFAVCCPETDLDGALQMAERIRETISRTTVKNEDISIKLTVSVGVAEIHAGDRSIEGLLERADKLLYQAKDQGRNCVAFNSPAG